MAIHTRAAVVSNVLQRRNQLRQVTSGEVHLARQIISDIFDHCVGQWVRDFRPF